MAGLFIVAGMVMIDRHRQKKERKEARIIYNDRRYRALEEETRQRLSQYPAGDSSSASPTSPTSEPSGDDFSEHEVVIDERPFERPQMQSRNKRMSWQGVRTWYSKKTTRRRSPSEHASVSPEEAPSPRSLNRISYFAN